MGLALIGLALQLLVDVLGTSSAAGWTVNELVDRRSQSVRIADLKQGGVPTFSALSYAAAWILALTYSLD